ncbi:hypothetical protein ASC89_15140 [Devosia sp. Root413D1]|uniref:PD-(D/E)XK nuclease domain-containing protein n=1 Tax=Devosia sp. Root413D1 TaxID=1736531 RepID=UPI0006F80F8D|nr:hypothetical protein [Devosia sp. Root413D1]KQW78138.1 hypothetical protein ASC89_15140 [Devosia sp. Root413D1]
MRLFDHDFEYLDDEHLQDMVSLQREGAIYSDQWVDHLDDFRHVRIPFTSDEVIEYVRSMKALDHFLSSGKEWAREVPEIPPDIASRADAYGIHTVNGESFGPPWHCPAAFMGVHLERIVCGMDQSRRQVIEEQGTALFLSTIRRAADALTPAIRCFANRERGLQSWPVTREDDIRDLLYAMLRASISDIRREEPVPSRVGASRVADLHSGLAKTLIEIKWIGAKGRWRRVLDEMLVDIQTYGRHPDCDHLVFIVVDSVRGVPDPYLVESDLTGEQIIDGKPVRVITYVRGT